ncbi:hypothetical protein H105_06742 [Trichophyton soudanense CBS 452.61]|uniref:Uncharacterized protein n=1 Tax=Trichophyton soudanense CBS 452.61 TaxID=1215331 RepID=A0A022XK60_TRISD|nr:hypothetical protein H105_06742 [Trichophyton soudanense CBS 452.61]EZG03056.1 hypothetical protein H106_06572 [Trichophyton rubrum CBS 735.88]
MVAVARLRPVGNAAKQSHIQSQSRIRNHMSPIEVRLCSVGNKRRCSLTSELKHRMGNGAHGGNRNEFELIDAVQPGRRGCQNRLVDTNPTAFNRFELDVVNGGFLAMSTLLHQLWNLQIVNVHCPATYDNQPGDSIFQPQRVSTPGQG